MRNKYSLTERDLTTSWKGEGFLELFIHENEKSKFCLKNQNPTPPYLVVFLAESAVAGAVTGGGRSQQFGPTPALGDG